MRYEYKVVQIREGLIGGKMSSDKLEKTLNEWASQGWRVKAITTAEVKGRDVGLLAELNAQVKGRVGPGGTEGVLVTFERQIG